jgi:hypothetical protein
MVQEFKTATIGGSFVLDTIGYIQKNLLPVSIPTPRRKGTASSPKGGLLCAVALHFFVMVFVSQRTCTTLFF